MSAFLKRLSALMLAALLIAAVFGCGGDKGADSGETSAEITEPEAEEAETTYPPPDASDLDLKGQKVNFIAPQWSTCNYLFAEELDGDAVNDEAYRRAADVEEVMGIEIENFWGQDTDTHQMVLKTVKAGDDAYQIVFTHCIYGLQDYVVSGALYPLDNLPRVDLEAPWWDKTVIESMRLGGKIFYAAGDLLLQNPSCMVFNKTISDNYGFDNHYEAASEGKWTFDRFYEEARGVSVDLDGDGEIGINDQSGYAGDLTESLCDITYACGEKCSIADGDWIKLVFYSEKMLDMFEKAYSYFTDSSVCQGYFRQFAAGQNFSSGLSLFSITSLSGVVGLRDADVDFGILPLPKYNEEQERYSVFPWPIFVCVPTTVQSPELVGATLERFCYESTPVLTAQNEILIRGKSTRDEESLAMIDIIQASYVSDIGASYLGFDPNFTKVFYSFTKLIQKKNENLASEYTKAEKAILKSIDKLCEKIAEVSEG